MVALVEMKVELEAVGLVTVGQLFDVAVSVLAFASASRDFDG